MYCASATALPAPFLRRARSCGAILYILAMNGQFSKSFFTPSYPLQLPDSLIFCSPPSQKYVAEITASKKSNQNGFCDLLNNPKMGYFSGRKGFVSPEFKALSCGPIVKRICSRTILLMAFCVAIDTILDFSLKNRYLPRNTL